jgi:transcription initiation factor TFIID subunit TAF12
VPLPPGCPVLLDVLCARQRPPQGANCSDGTTAGTKGDKQQQVQQQEHKKQQQQQQPDRRVLHVQSISDWAPSCIGPYSQVLWYVVCSGCVRQPEVAITHVGPSIDYEARAGPTAILCDSKPNQTAI